MIRRGFLSLLLLPCAALANYQPSNEQPPDPPREFRGAWVASVWNIDWPSTPNISAADQRNELTKILDEAARLKLNAIILQVRSECDAMYDSKIEPWSFWLTAKQGRGPGDGVDPLPRAIREAHDRGIELHAWFNPFRARANTRQPVASNHVTVKHKDWLLPAEGKIWLNPGLRAVQDRAINVMVDVAKRYDVDGIHIDDYFYPYPKPAGGGKMKLGFNDAATYLQYKQSGGRLAVSDWRRSQIDGFIQRLSQSVHQAKSGVKFGVSPFGIYRPGLPAGIEANIDPYEHLAADSRKWLDQGWVDYLSPQLYWRIDQTQHSYTTLVKWWSQQNSKGRHLWPGIASARIKADGSDKNRRASESIRQIEQARQFASNRQGAGHIHWSWNAIEDNRDGLKQALAKPYAEPALVPATPWLATDSWRRGEQPNVNFKLRSDGIAINWQAMAKARWFVVQSKSNGAWRTERILPGTATSFVFGRSPQAFSVRAVDRFGQLSAAAVMSR